MPAIDVTMADGVAIDVTVGGIGSGGGGSYTDAKAVAAMDGATITPKQVGTTSDPVGETYADELSAQTAKIGKTITVTENYGGANDIGEAFNNARADHGVDGICYDFDPGIYTLTTAIDLTGIRSTAGVFINLYGVQLNQTGYLGIDMTGSHKTIVITGGELYSRAADPGAIGILIGRDTTDKSAGLHTFRDVGVWGFYKIACLANVASEVNDYFSCTFHGKISGANMWGPAYYIPAVLITQNSTGLSSTYSTLIGQSQATSQANNFYGGAIVGRDSAIELRPSPDCIIRGVVCHNVYMGAENQTIKLNYTDGGNIELLTFRNIRSTDNTADYFVNHETPNGTGECVGFMIDGSRVTTHLKDIEASNVNFNNVFINRSTKFNQQNGLYFNEIANSDISLRRHQTIESTNGFKGSYITVNRTTDMTGDLKRSEVFAYGKGKRILESGGSEYHVRGDFFGVTGTANLARQTGNFDGAIQRDDGTNLTKGEYAYWDSQNTQWRAMSDPANKTVDRL